MFQIKQRLPAAANSSPLADSMKKATSMLKIYKKYKICHAWIHCIVHSFKLSLAF